MHDDGDLILESEVKANKWSIRPCHLYKEEYRDCRSIKGRFQQYFVHGDSLGKKSFKGTSINIEMVEGCLADQLHRCGADGGCLINCGSWEHDFEDCIKLEEKDDIKAASRIIENETKRRKDRMKAHFGNNVWKKRKAAPEDWAKPLPDRFMKEYENSFLDIKSKEMKGIPISSEAANSIQSNRCTIM